MKFILFALILFIFATLSDCTVIKLATYNTALTGDYDRVEEIVKFLPKDADVLTLQEVWYKEDAEKIISMMEPYYTSHYYTPMDRGPVIGCSPQYIPKLQTLTACLQKIVPKVTWSTATACINEIYDLMNSDPNCATCVFSKFGDKVPDLMPCIQNQGYGYSYNGSAGILIFSKKEIEKVSFTPLKSFVIRRGLVEMCIDGIYYITSHFPFKFPIPVPQYNQEDFSKEIILKRPNIIMGDLNSGTKYQKEGYMLLEKYGYNSINRDISTYCTNSIALVGDCITDPDKNTNIDHIMYDNEISVNSVRFNRKALYKIQPFADKSLVTGVLLPSDHIGIRTIVTVEYERQHIYCS